MKTFDHDYVQEISLRLDKIAPDAKPRWGSMTPSVMMDHLGKTVRYSMGKAPHLPVVGKWHVRNIIGPLMINGLIKLPKNAKMPRAARTAMEQTPVTGDAETLQAVMEEYLHAIATGDIDPPPHPVFGSIGVDGWAKFHIRHFEHHLTQFGV